MTIELRTADGDRIVSHGAMLHLEREAAAEGLHLASWPHPNTGNRLRIVRYCTDAAEREDVETRAYLGLPIPPPSQR